MLGSLNNQQLSVSQESVGSRLQMLLEVSSCIYCIALFRLLTHHKGVFFRDRKPADPKYVHRRGPEIEHSPG
jgi:hypothetical protein